MLEALLRGPDEVLTPCQLRVTSFASKSRLVDRHPLYVPASAAPHVRASHYGLRLAHCSEQYDHGPKITTTDWQTRSAGDEEVTNLEARGSMVGTTGGDEHWFAVVSLNDTLAEYYRSDLRASTAQLSIRLHRWAVAGDQTRPGLDAGAHSDTNGMGAQTPTEKYGVRSPFHAGGGGGRRRWQRCRHAGVGRRIEHGARPAFGCATHPR